jgi:hypothetical protein
LYTIEKKTLEHLGSISNAYMGRCFSSARMALFSLTSYLK